MMKKTMLTIGAAGLALGTSASFAQVQGNSSYATVPSTSSVSTTTNYAQPSYSGGAAKEYGAYLGLGYTFLDLETNDDIGDSTSAVTARFGYALNRELSLEVEGSFGVDSGSFDFEEDEEDFEIDDNDDGDLDDVLIADGDLGLDYLFAAFVRYGVPVSDALKVSGRVGYAFAEIDSTVELASTEIEFGGSEDGLAFGAGLEYTFTPSSTLLLDYTRYEFTDSNGDAVTAMYQYKF
ncbi:hypothetical protein PB2503_03787 [Parvularcula bermudensis HTCC2503]|uniref:Outer membrane protein beta-barrel domain-containing protein n=1 Tax=Parvularcula bermudensis (strain ATCC BAA-594 / HTCC2503 / KCTC 12087) TaxID=314260 RepID=E0TE11_PARBH|nr:outer membrane beta-barrel protein [Parvularcula bermudensis]ADM08832.1 hypothetical protein PB2503_03787 [Parvularcula bermudensis HTCC2503]